MPDGDPGVAVKFATGVGKVIVWVVVAVPVALVTVSRTTNDAPDGKVCVTLAPVPVAPPPKSQAIAENGAPVDVLVHQG